MNEKESSEEAERIAKMARGQKTQRIANLTDPATIEKYFGDRFVPYDFTEAGRRFQGVIVPSSKAKSYFATLNYPKKYPTA